MPEVAESTRQTAEIPSLTAYLDRLRGVVSDEDLTIAELAWRKAYAPECVEVAVDVAASTIPDAQETSRTQPENGDEGVQAQPSNLMRYLELGVTALVAISVALVLFTVASPRPKPAISFAMLDPNIAVAKYLETPGVADLDEQTFGTAVTKFHQALEVEMLRYSKETGRVLLSGAVVFAGDVPDVTTMLTDAARANTPPLPKPLPPATPAPATSGANP